MFSHLSKYTRPEPLSSALITIDLQNDFVRPGAPAESAGAADAAVKTGELVQFYRELQLPIIHVIRIYSPEDNAKNVDVCRREAIENGLQLVVSGTEGMQPVSEIVPEGFRANGELLRKGGIQTVSEQEFMIYKPRWGCFYQTPLQQLLNDLKISTVAIAGTWFSNCVRTTIYEATARDYRAVALSDAIAGIYEQGEIELANIQCGVCSCNDWSQFVRNAG